MEYKVNSFIHFLDKNKIFNADSLELFQLELAEYKNLKLNDLNKIKKERLNKMIKSNIVVKKIYNEINSSLKKREKIESILKTKYENKIGYMRISLTENCNLSCKYCFVNQLEINQSRENKNMDTNDFIKYIKLFIEHNKQGYPTIQYFGGEPLMRLDLIEIGNNMLKAAKKIGKIKGYSQTIVTNGILINEEFANYAIKNNIALIISIDGKKDINDENRVYKNGQGSYDDIVKGMNNYAKAGGLLSCILTINNSNINKAEEITNFLINDLNCKEISINSPQPCNEGWEIDGELFAKTIFRIWSICNKKNIKTFHLGKNVAFLLKTKFPQISSCVNLTYGEKVNTWGIYLNSNGIASNCLVEQLDSSTQEFSNTNIDENFINWRFMNKDRSQCTHCIAYNICGGTCSIEKSYLNSNKNIERCNFYQKMVPLIIDNQAI